MKKAYWISLYLEVNNQENLKKYAETVTPIIKGYGGKPLVRGGNHQTDAQAATVRVQARYRPAIAPSPKSPSTIFLADIR